MILLAIDTTGPRLQLALMRDGAVDTLVEDLAQGQAERILPAIGELLARNGVAYPDLGRIAVTTGPGSFTGLRIGLSAARGLGLALGVPVVGVPTLLAMSLTGPQGPFAVVVDARRSEAYVQSFAAPGIPLDDARIAPVTDLPGSSRLDLQVPDVAALARFAATVEPAEFLPDPAYIRDADAKPQEKFRVALQ